MSMMIIGIALPSPELRPRTPTRVPRLARLGSVTPGLAFHPAHDALPCTQRLMRDFKRLQSDPPEGANGSPNPDNIMKWNAVIFGPEDTPWDGGEALAAAC